MTRSSGRCILKFLTLLRYCHSHTAIQPMVEIIGGADVFLTLTRLRSPRKPVAKRSLTQGDPLPMLAAQEMNDKI
jgi:hypothetical protein